MKSLHKVFCLLIIAVLFHLPLFAQQGYKVGDSVEDFRLKNIDGIYVTMGMYKKAFGYIVVFTCDHCPYAKAYQERIKALADQYRGQGYILIAINPNDPTDYPEDSYDSMKIRAKNEHFNFPYLWDGDQKIATRFGATHTPHVFVLQKPPHGKGDKAIVRYIGAIDDNYSDATQVNNKYVEDAVNALLHHQYPKVENTKAIGCSIKWKKS